MTSCRVIGPAAPPPEVLEAAAKLTEAEEELRLVDSHHAGFLSRMGRPDEVESERGARPSLSYL